MKLRYKVPIIILICFGVLLIALNQVFDALVLKDYQAVEQKFLDKDIDRVRAVLEVTGRALIRNAEGFGFWDDTYNFMKGTNPKYKTETISYEGIGAFGIDHMLFIDKKERLKESIKLKHEDKSFTALDPDSIAEIESYPEFTKLLGIGESRTGIIKLKDEAFQYAVVPIQDNNAIQPPVGNIIVTAKIDKKFYDNLGRQTKLSLRMLLGLIKAIYKCSNLLIF